MSLNNTVFVPLLQAPLILTLQLDRESTSFFREQRRKYYPAHANYTEAHLTLFHHLPGGIPDIEACVARYCRRPGFRLQVKGLCRLGKTVAYELGAPELALWHGELQQALMPWLTRRDQQVFRPHITIQNKVTAFKSQLLYEQLCRDFKSFAVTALGIDAWQYRKGAWVYLQSWLFEDTRAGR